MFASSRTLLVLAVVVLALAAPSTALAEPADLSATDSVATDVDADGTSNTSSAATTAAAATSPTVDTYGGGTEILPPPVTDVETEVTEVATGTEVEGGGGGEVPVEQPVVSEPLPVAVDAVPEAPSEPVAGGGGPELPYTGLPLWYAIWAGAGLMAVGFVLWGVRSRVRGVGGE